MIGIIDDESSFFEYKPVVYFTNLVTLENAAYAASKGAVLAMTKTWARGLAAEDILLYAIAPGWVETRMAPKDIEDRKEAVKEIPLGRVAKPEEVGSTIAFLLSGACPSATGSTIDIIV